MPVKKASDIPPLPAVLTGRPYGDSLMRNIVALTLILFALSACANQGLRQLYAPGDGPDEFIIDSSESLQQPPSYADLPTPTPGSANLTDKLPLQDAVVAMGGRAEDANAGIPASDTALVQSASRFGVTQNIRETLAETDEDFRRRKARFTQIRIVPTDLYDQVYRQEALDPARVASQWRASGARTPAFPPPP